MKTVRSIKLLIFLLTTALTGKAQVAPALPLPSLDGEDSQRWVVKFAPLSLLDPSNTIQFGLERMMGQRYSLQVEFGYGPESMNVWHSSFTQRFKNVEIWRGRVEWRYYRRRGPIGSYIAFEGLYKQLNANEEGTIGVGCDSNPYGCQYYQLSRSPISKRVWAAHIKIGRQFRLLPNSNRWLGDLYAGIGIRGSSVERGIQPSGFNYYESVGMFDLFSTGDYPSLSLSYGIKVGYSF